MIHAVLAAWLACAPIEAAIVTQASDVRVWIVPFASPAASAEGSRVERGELLAELLAVFFSQEARCTVVERQFVERILAEHSLSMAGLAGGDRTEMGKLLGATHLVTGSLFAVQDELVITAVAVEIESGRIVASAHVRGPEHDVAEMARELCCSLDAELGGTAAPAASGAAEPAPVANLHFLRGLSAYYAGRHNQAMAEFLHAQSDATLADLARLWTARCHAAEGRNAAACFELARVREQALSAFARDLYRRERDHAEGRLSPAERRLCRQLAPR